MSQTVSHPTEPHMGLQRSAALMRALGADAQHIWERLSPDEAAHLSQIMRDLPDTPEQENAAIGAYLSALEVNEGAPTSSSGTSIWRRLSEEEPAVIVALVERESPQIVAVILSFLSHERAAQIITALPQALAIEVLRRLLYLEDIHPRVTSVLEVHLSRAITQHERQNSSGHERLARIFDQVDSKTEKSLLFALDDAEPGAGEKVRSLMFTFDDLANLDPASLQTLLSNIERDTLIMALKGAKAHVAEAFMTNMTQRAGELLREDIDASGPLRRSEVESSRTKIANQARTLIKRGDMLSREEDDELVE